MKTEFATYYRRGHQAKVFPCATGSKADLVNLLDAEGKVIRTDVPVYGPQEKALPDCYAMRGKIEGALPPQPPKPKAEKESQADSTPQSLNPSTPPV